MERDLGHTSEIGAEWQLVAKSKIGGLADSTHRLKVPGGWLYRYVESLVFVPSPDEEERQDSQVPHPSE